MFRIKNEIIKQLVEKALKDEWVKINKEEKALDSYKLKLESRERKIREMESIELRSIIEVETREKEIKDSIEEFKRKEPENQSYYKEKTKVFNGKLEEIKWLKKS